MTILSVHALINVELKTPSLSACSLLFFDDCLLAFWFLGLGVVFFSLSKYIGVLLGILVFGTVTVGCDVLTCFFSVGVWVTFLFIAVLDLFTFPKFFSVIIMTCSVKRKSVLCQQPHCLSVNLADLSDTFLFQKYQ